MTVRNIKKMIDYCIKMPEKEEYEKGHKYPYYSCEILCSMNGLNLERILNTYDDNDDDDDENKDKDEDNKDEDKNEKEMKIDNDNDNDEKDEDKNKDKDEIEEEDNDKSEGDNKNKDKDKGDNKKEEEKMEVEEDEYQEDAKNVKEKRKELPNYNLLNSVLDHFFSFLQEKSSIDNYVLMGYFNKITNYLIKTRTKIILVY